LHSVLEVLDSAVDVWAKSPLKFVVSTGGRRGDYCAVDLRKVDVDACTEEVFALNRRTPFDSPVAVIMFPVTR
jgi:hypothetical protein